MQLPLPLLSPAAHAAMSQLQDLNSEASFKSHLSSLPAQTLVILYFHAPWAAPCAQMRTILETLASGYTPTTPPSIAFLSIDAESLPEISESYDVTAVPYLVLQRDGKTLETVSGTDAVKVRAAVERHYVDSEKDGKEKGKRVELPPKLEVTERFDRKHDVVNMNGGNDKENNNEGDEAKNLAAYAPTSSDPPTAPSMSGAADLSSTAQDPVSPKQTEEELNKRLTTLVKAAPVMLFMKGTPSAPQCGFSRQLVSILRERGVRYGFFNILADEDVRQGLKAFADWPTYPQLWVGGDLVGVLDIVSLLPFSFLIVV